MKELAVRALSGAVYVALVLGAAWAGALTTCALFLVIAILAVIEWHRLVWRERPASFRPANALVITVLSYALVLPGDLQLAAPAVAPWLWAGLIGLIALATIRNHSPKTALLFGVSLVAYIAFPMACATWFVQRDPMLFIGFMLLLWTNDTGAYLVGKSIGRNKLMPTVSPGKTWEGLLGGIGLTVLVGWLWSKQCGALAPSGWIVAAVVVSITATVGDLLESWMKRRAGVKDSGSIMPGHGGVLDRFDGYLLAAPAMVLVWTLAA
ncbi:MAG: phosphatidate cytidylyltransferase [Flavobacteriales bacterium]|nr:phosphatidate cytidylyltransferase [Flavobacteriales bacterium]